MNLPVFITAGLLAFSTFAAAQTQTITVRKQDTVQAAPLAYADQMPEFPGGEEALFKWIHNRIKATPEQLPPRRAYVQFVIDTTGAVTEIELLRSSGNPGIDSTLLDAVRTMPLWKPARNNGRPVPVVYRLPLQICLK